MNTYIGIDLGTSAVKLLLVDATGRILASHSETYPIYYPHDGWSEQNPRDWMQAVSRAIPFLTQGVDKSTIRGIGFGGQMHGLVALDAHDNVLRPCILWNDGRTEEEVAYLNEKVGRDTLTQYTANIAFAGFTAPKLLWMRRHEPELFAQISKIMLPKDYLAYCLTGVHATDYSDASGTLLLDVEHRTWSREMCALCGISEGWLPALYESYQSIGTLSYEYARLWGLSTQVQVAIGGGDNAVAAIGVGAVHQGDCNISLGTSGTVFICNDRFSVDSANALHSFCHANGSYHLMGCILSAAACNAWWMDILQSADFDKEQLLARQYMGNNTVYFLPYLMGERSPHNDVHARGAFWGLQANTTRAQLTLAVMEGVAFALRDCVEVARQNGVTISTTKICGGGAKSRLWCAIIANVLGVEVQAPTIQEGPGFGGALLAMVACGEYASLDDAVSNLCTSAEAIRPDPALMRSYDTHYRTFAKLYPALKPVQD